MSCEDSISIHIFVNMEIVSTDRCHFDPEEAEGKQEKELTSKLKELRFDDDDDYDEQAGVRRYTSGLKKKLRLEFTIDPFKLKKIIFESPTLMQSMKKTHFHFGSNGFRALKNLSVINLTITTTCFNEFCRDFNLVRYLRPLNCKNFEGNAALHLSASTKQPQALRMLPRNDLADVNALNSGGFRTVDTPCDLPDSENVESKIDMILTEAGARASDITNQGMEHNDDNSHRRLSNRSSDMSTVKLIIGSRNALLLIATLLTTITYQVPFHLLGKASKEGYVHNYITTDTLHMNKQYSLFPNTFLLFNSIVFIASVVMTLFLLHEFPLKPWPQISVSALFGSYMYSIKAISPNGALALLFISIPFSLLAAARKLYVFATQNFM